MAEQTGAELITAERMRQVSSEGWTAEHDAFWNRGELAWAAAHYAAPGPVVHKADGVPVFPLAWANEDDKKPKHDRIRQLTIAGALCAAEIDRLKRIEGQS